MAFLVADVFLNDEEGGEEMPLELSIVSLNGEGDQFKLVLLEGESKTVIWIPTTEFFVAIASAIKGN